MGGLSRLCKYMHIIPFSRRFLLASMKHRVILIHFVDMSKNLNSFRRGVTDFRNARDWTMKKRRVYSHCKYQDAKYNHNVTIELTYFFKLYLILKLGRQTVTKTYLEPIFIIPILGISGSLKKSTTHPSFLFVNLYNRAVICNRKTLYIWSGWPRSSDKNSGPGCSSIRSTTTTKRPFFNSCVPPTGDRCRGLSLKFV